MRDLVTRLSPWGRTSRSHYWLIIFASALLSLGAVGAKDVVGAALLVMLLVAVQFVVLVATTRRLHDAGRSRWWLLLFLFPMSITWDLLRVQIGVSTWHFLDVSAAITLIPVLIGLLASSQSTSGDGIPEGHAAL